MDGRVVVRLVGGIAAVVVAAGSLRAQPSARIDAGFFHPEGIQVFLVGDLGLTGGPVAPIFWVQLSNPDTTPHEVILSLRVEDGAGQLLASGQSDEFSLEPGVLRITNQDLQSGARPCRLRNYQIEREARELVDKVLKTGRLPSGVYRFRLALTDLTAGGREEAVIEANLTNPTMLDLIAPGAPADAEPPQIYTSFPLFRWESNATRFRLIVAERSGAPGETPEAAIANNVRFEREIFVRRGDEAPPQDLPADAVITPGTFFQYPTGGVLPLLEDSTYYWRVVALVPTSSDPQHPLEISSSIWAFRVARPGAIQTSALWERLRELLGTLLSAEQFDGFFGQGGQLAGFRPTGVIRHNGKAISPEELERWMTEVRSGRWKVTSATVE